MEKLPPTSYVRMVDIWLICGQLIPFVEVMLLTLMELYNENENDTINHHGEPITVHSDAATTSTKIQVSSASPKSEENEDVAYEDVQQENASHYLFDSRD